MKNKNLTETKINEKYMGSEPVYDLNVPLTSLQFIQSMNWYSYMCDTNDARNFIKNYLITQKRFEDIEKLENVPDIWVLNTLGWVCRLLTKDYILPLSKSENVYINEKLSDMFSHIKIKSEIFNVIQNTMKDKQLEILGNIENLIDKNGNISIYDYLKTNQIPLTYIPNIINYYTEWLNELQEGLNASDNDLKYAYSYMSKNDLRDRIKFFEKLVDDCKSYINVIKNNKQRKPRTIKTPSKEKILKFFVYQKEDNVFKISSINPEKIIGAQELWTFNTKYKIVTVFKAVNRNGLNINRTAITNFDKDISISKSSSRQSEMVLDKIKNGGKIILKSVMKDLKTDKPLQTRINEHTILLKVL